MKNKNIYVALAYSPNPQRNYDDCCEIAFRQANSYAAKLADEGYRVFSPISQSHPIAELMRSENKKSYEYWMHTDLSFIELWADELHVICNDGWEFSPGVSAEMRAAVRKGIPIVFVQL